MQDLQALETLEIEILDLLNSRRLLDSLYFGGGTMLRLCHQLDRFSTDMDFWMRVDADAPNIFRRMKDVLGASYTLSDAANKRSTLLFELKSTQVRRRLKLEVRKGQSAFEWERKIAFSAFSTRQVLVNGLTLQQMMHNKVDALLSRKLIRDCYDIQFLFMRGAKLPDDRSVLSSIKDQIDRFTKRDYTVLLGSVLAAQERAFHVENRFGILREEIRARLKDH